MLAYMSIAQTLCVGVTMVGQRLPVLNSTLVSYYSGSRKLRWNGCLGFHVKVTGGVEASEMSLFLLVVWFPGT
jgi:hypothetical protein